MESRSVDYFKNLFQPPTIHLPSIPIIFPKIVSPSMNRLDNTTTEQPLEEEVKNTLFSFQTNKFSDLDRFASKFFRKIWPDRY